MKFISLLFIIFTVLKAESITIKGGVYIIPSQKTFYRDYVEKKIELKEFSIDKYEVSNTLFGKKNIYEDEINFPVVKITYDEAVSFCKSRGGNLPTQEQWIVASSFEKGSFYLFATKKYPIFDEKNINVVQERAIELQKEGFGAFNDLVDVEDALIGNNDIVGMSANVWEMILSRGEYVMLKGGSFFNSESIDMMNTLVENSVLKSSLKEYEHIGFRCAYEK